MVWKAAVFVLVFTLVIAWGPSRWAAQENAKKRRTGTVIGELKSRKETNKGKNVILEILAAGEERARAYAVLYDPKTKGPNAEVLATLNTAKIGDRVKCDWAYLDEGGPVVMGLQVFRKTDAKKGDSNEK